MSDEPHPEHALLVLYDRSVDDLHRYASRLAGGDQTRAEELVQETSLGVLRRLRAGEQLDGDTMVATEGGLTEAAREHTVARRPRRARCRSRPEPGVPGAAGPARVMRSSRGDVR